MRNELPIIVDIDRERDNIFRRFALAGEGLFSSFSFSNKRPVVILVHNLHRDASTVIIYNLSFLQIPYSVAPINDPQ